MFGFSCHWRTRRPNCTGKSLIRTAKNYCVRRTCVTAIQFQLPKTKTSPHGFRLINEFGGADSRFPLCRFRVIRWTGWTYYYYGDPTEFIIGNVPTCLLGQDLNHRESVSLSRKSIKRYYLAWLWRPLVLVQLWLFY